MQSKQQQQQGLETCHISSPRYYYFFPFLNSTNIYLDIYYSYVHPMMATGTWDMSRAVGTLFFFLFLSFYFTNYYTQINYEYLHHNNHDHNHNCCHHYHHHNASACRVNGSSSRASWAPGIQQQQQGLKTHLDLMVHYIYIYSFLFLLY